MTVRMTSPSTSNCAASGVRSSSARAEWVIAVEVCPRAGRLSNLQKVKRTFELRIRARPTMLFEAMNGKRIYSNATAGDLRLGLRALALLLPQ